VLEQWLQQWLEGPGRKITAELSMLKLDSTSEYIYSVIVKK
jgi:hypothetical protein